MKLIKTGSNYIKVDPQSCEPGYVWGERWNRNEQKFGLCMLHKVDGYALVDEKDLPGKLPTLPIDEVE